MTDEERAEMAKGIVDMFESAEKQIKKGIAKELQEKDARIAELEAALKPFAEMQPVSSHLGPHIHSVSPGAIVAARAALEKKND